MILITGAAGKTGRAVLRALAEKSQAVKALVFRVQQIQEVEKLGAKAVVVGDMRDPKILVKAMQGVNSVYHICPNVHPDETPIGQRIVDAAVAAGITHFVYHSVLHPQIEAMPHHWNKMRVEEWLFQSGLPYTILQPAAYMQNILVGWKNILERGKYCVPYAIESRISMVDLEDVALAAATVLVQKHPKTSLPLHSGAIYELSGTQAMSQAEVATTLSRVLHRPVSVDILPIETWEHNARASGMDDYQVNTLLSMFSYYEKYGLTGNSQVLSWLINRPATSFESFGKREAEARLHLVS